MNRPWMKFYPADWRADELLGMCTLAARGLWIEMIGIMHSAEPYGHLVVHGRPPTDSQLAALARCPLDQIPSLLDELESAGVYSRTRKGVIYSRRMTRDERRAIIAVKNGASGGNPQLRGKKLDRGAKPDLVEAVWAKGAGKCHYCGIALTRDGNRRTAFEIDHVIPRSKGGSNDLSNLVSSCPPCNNAKSDNLLDKPPDKAQKPEPESKEGSVSSLRSDTAAGPLELKRALWDSGKRLLMGNGRSKAEAGSLIGKWCQRHTQGIVLDALAKAEAATPAGDIVGYIEAILKGGKALGGEAPQANLEDERLVWRAIVSSWLQRGQKPSDWPEGRGVPPGRHGCQVPPDILAEYGLSAKQHA